MAPTETRSSNIGVHDAGEPTDFPGATRRAQLRLVVAGLIKATVLGLIVALLSSWWVGLIVALVAAGSWVLWIRSLVTTSTARVVAATGARELGDDELASFRNALEGVSVLSGVPVPGLHLLEQDEVNALVAAVDDDAQVVLTQGLIDGAGPVLLELVAAELLCRVRDGSAAYLTLVAALPSWLDFAAGTTPTAVAKVLGEHRAGRADLDALALTRYPPALVTLLSRMQEHGTEVDTADRRGAALWIAPAVGSGRGVAPAVDATANQPVDQRLALVREL